MVQHRPTLRLVKGGLAADPDGVPGAAPEGEGDAGERGPADVSERQAPSSADEALLADIRAGRPGTATAVYERLQPVVSRTVTRLLGRRDPDFADLVQQALIEIVLHVERFRGEGSFEGWAAVTTAHVVWKHLRRRRLERRLFEELVPDIPMVGGSPAREAQWRETAHLLKRHLDGMNVERASAFVLHDVWGYDLREMADIIGVSVAAAQSRLSRGRRELEARIAKDPDLAGALADERALARGEGVDQ